MYIERVPVATVLSGLEVIRKNNFSLIKGRNVGLAFLQQRYYILIEYVVL